jgi:hypothetical protein
MTTRTDAGPRARRRATRANVVPIASFVAAGMLAVAFGVFAAGSRTDAGAGASVWEGAVVEAMELEGYTSLAEMARSADAVVRGQVVAVEPGRIFGEPTGTQLHYAAATIRVEEVLAGGLPSRDADRVTLEIPLFDGPHQIAGLQDGLPWAETVFFLRSKAESARDAGMSREAQLAETGYYRLVTMRALLVNEEGSAVPMTDSPDFLAELEGIDFEEVVDTIRSSGG